VLEIKLVLFALVFLWDLCYLTATRTMQRVRNDTPPKKISVSNAALFNTSQSPKFLDAALDRSVQLKSAIVISENEDFLKTVPPARRITFVNASLDRAPIEQNAAIAKLLPRLKRPTTSLIVDMRWAITNMEGISSLERWGAVASALAAQTRKPVISVYDQDLVVEEQMQTAFRVHRQFIAPSGVYTNPYWLPAAMLETSSLDEQLAFMLGSIVPDHQGLHLRRKGGEMLARGATPSWLPKSSAALGSGTANTRWHIHCFGKLRVFIGGREIDWRIAGSTPKKTRTLFAYLLQRGEKGAHADQLSELLWPGEAQEETKRARLHHTVAMLRKTIGYAESVLRNGDYYNLNPPSGSWIDIETFEQQCRRGLALFKKGEDAAALQLYLAAHQLYAGDLFEDLPREYAESEQENWCIPRRTWLQEMALKLQTDMTRALLKTGRTREALEHCMKALAIDPASESANAEAMRIFEAQGREEAIHRQYRQYVQAVKAVGATESPELKALHQKLTGRVE
jgi:DNA-binding SARP family transcriptional activator